MPESNQILSKIIDDKSSKRDKTDDASVSNAHHGHGLKRNFVSGNVVTIVILYMTWPWGKDNV